MMQDALTLYKLIVLYMLDKASFPLTKTQVSDFIQEKDYTNFFTLQQVFSELVDTELVNARSIRNRTQLSITEEGRETLRFFGNRISDAIRQDIDTYFQENEIQLRNEVSVQSNYYKSTNGEYEAHLLARDRGITLVDITLSVPTEELASSICENWQKKNQSIYQYLTEQLF
ncbi:MAG: DUF4364 family protein [Lachnospiraceae bacterium]|nr:DUF4364 family protein [Lachnospiraceae bacterium]